MSLHTTLVRGDGSKLPDGKTGSGITIYQFGIKVCSKAFPLDHQKDCFDAEAFAALQGIRAAIALPSARFSNDIWVFIDNVEEETKLLKRTPTVLAQAIFLEALEVAKTWKARTRLPHTLGGNINDRYIPEHSDIEGNELADMETMRGASMPCPEKLKFSFSTLEKWQAAQRRRDREDWWQNYSPPAYQKLEITMRLSS
ncbi:hypothetical protein K3495_g12603 [Podosphaera aphanis]|nr:hypothetical protein K3495_g12603 [Podosphaera aphanis]